MVFNEYYYVHQVDSEIRNREDCRWSNVHGMYVMVFISQSLLEFCGFSQGPWLDWFIDVANDHPYLWALYAFAIVMPFVICAAFCVRSKVSCTLVHEYLIKHPQKVCILAFQHCISFPPSPPSFSLSLLPKPKPGEEDAAKRKKTDAPSPDDPRPSEEDKTEREGKPSSSQPEESFIAEADEVHLLYVYTLILFAVA